MRDDHRLGRLAARGLAAAQRIGAGQLPVHRPGVEPGLHVRTLPPERHSGTATVRQAVRPYSAQVRLVKSNIQGPVLEHSAPEDGRARHRQQGREHQPGPQHGQDHVRSSPLRTNGRVTPGATLVGARERTGRRLPGDAAPRAASRSRRASACDGVARRGAATPPPGPDRACVALGARGRRRSPAGAPCAEVVRAVGPLDVRVAAGTAASAQRSCGHSWWGRPGPRLGNEKTPPVRAHRRGLVAMGQTE